MASQFNSAAAAGATWIKLAVGLAVVLVLLWVLAPVAIVPTGFRGVMTTFGKADDESFDPGIHLMTPVISTMHLMDTRIQKGEAEGDAASKDLQQVHTRIAINFHLDPTHVVSAFRDIGPTTEVAADRIIVPAVQESVKAVTAKFTAEELVTRRTEVRDQVGGLLREKMTRHGLLLDEFAIVNFQFSKSFAEAIEAKVKAEQDKLKAERDLQRIMVEAQQKVTSAKAEAEALSLQKAQVTPELLSLRRTENEREAIRKWDGRLPTTTGGVVPFIDVNPSPH